jgi:5-methylthioadenosine/S-adenosylhomocysteine deaminase
MSIIIKGVHLDGKKRDIYIEKEKITEISEKISTEAEYKIDGRNKAAIPGLINGHTHAAMALLRGYADDMELMPWLKEKIWPAEAKMTKEDIYWGSKFASLEMIKTGTTFFNDMYWEQQETVRAAQEMGLRSMIGLLMLDFDKRGLPENIKKIYSRIKYDKKLTKIAIAPHAIYTVSEDNLLWAKDFAEKNGLMLHIHLSETKGEVEDCIKLHGTRPVEYLEKIGFLSENVCAAHAVFLSDKEIDVLAKRKVKLLHNPVSNMKLSVGNAFRDYDIRKKGIKISLGTDGCSSNNSLDMFEDMKIAGLLQKHHHSSPTLMTAKEIFDISTKQGAVVFGLNCGEIKTGKLADLLLIDMKHHLMVPNHNLISNIVYSANGSVVDTTICNGKVLMENRKVPGEYEITEKFREHAEKLVG